MRALEKRITQTPAYALSQCCFAAKIMLEQAANACLEMAKVVNTFDVNKLKDIKHSDRQIDKYEEEICNYLLEIGKEELNKAESREISVILHMLTDIRAVNSQMDIISESYQAMVKKYEILSEDTKSELQLLQRYVSEIINRTVFVFEVQEGDKVYRLCKEFQWRLEYLRERYFEVLKQANCTADYIYTLTNIINAYESIIVKCRSITEALCKMDNINLQENAKDLQIH